MADMTYQLEGDVLTISLAGRVDSTNSGDVEHGIDEIREGHPATSVILDLEDLDYISSAGLRVILRLRKAVQELEIVNVSPAVYEIFEMTGFTEMLTIRKAYRTLSVEGCEVIGRGANGEVYRIDPDTIVKVYFNADALPEIHRERELARTAFVLGVPTAIPYDVVRVGNGYGSVFELLDAESYASLLISGEKSVDEIAKMSVDLLKIIHSTVVNPDSMPSMRDVALDWVDQLDGHLPVELHAKLKSLVEAVPEDNHMMHGDYHIKNVMVQNGESLLIDMDTLCHGHPIFELASMYNAYKGFGEVDHDVILRFMGIPYETTCELWDKILHLYFADADEQTVRDIDDKATLMGTVRIMRRAIRIGGLDTEEGRAEIEACGERLAVLIPKVDSLLF